MLKYKVKEFINSGDQIRSYVSIEEADVDKIRQYFDRTSVQKIQDEVIFAVLLAFGECGQEHGESLIKSVNSEGWEYMFEKFRLRV